MKDYLALKQGTFKKKHISFNLQTVLESLMQIVEYKASILKVKINLKANFASTKESHQDFAKKI
jgi:hypothetical protein